MENPGERAISIIVIEIVYATAGLGNKQIEITIIVVVSPNGVGPGGNIVNQTSNLHTAHFCECAISVVVIKRVLRGNVDSVYDDQIQITVVVIITPIGAD